MITMFSKNSWKWSAVAIILFVVVGITGLTSSKGTVSTANLNEANTDNRVQQQQGDSRPIEIDEVRQVIPGTLEVTKTISDYAHGQHIIWVEGRYKLAEGDLYLSFLDDKGNQLELGDRKADEVKPIDGDWSTFRHKLIEETGKIIETSTATIVFTLQGKGKGQKGLLAVPTLKPGGIFNQDKYKSQNNVNATGNTGNKNWQVVARTRRVQGTILKLAVTSDELKSIVLQVTKNIQLPNDPVDSYYEAGQTLEIVFNESLKNAGSFQDRLKQGSDFVVTVAQYAIPPDGKVVLGAYLKDTLYMQNDKYYDSQGQEQDLLPSSDLQFLTKPQDVVPVDLEITKNDQNSVDEGHSPWQLDPVQVTMTYVSLRISPNGVKGEFPVKWENLRVIQNTQKVAIVEVVGDSTPIRKVYLKRLVKQDNTGIWSVVGYDPA
ncbi:hypothetical protein JCM17380_00430 [Desulfosporosinus burensis]